MWRIGPSCKSRILSFWPFGFKALVFCFVVCVVVGSGSGDFGRFVVFLAL